MDQIDIEILEDGTIKSKTGSVSGENHQNAEAFLVYLAKLTGGTSKRETRGDAAKHSHTHDGTHYHSH